jgi:hypothetical protein
MEAGVERIIDGGAGRRHAGLEVETDVFQLGGSDHYLS